jgi:hypothetical protein
MSIDAAIFLPMDWQSAAFTFAGSLVLTVLIKRQIEHIQESLLTFELEDNSFKQTHEEMLKGTSQAIDLKDLETLIKSNISDIKAIAVDIVLDRAMSSEHLHFMLNSIQNGNIEKREEALIAIQLLSQNFRNRSILVRQKALKIIVRALKIPSSDQAHKHAVVALFHLVQDNDKRRVKLCSYNIVTILYHFLRTNPKRNSDLKYWCILLLHQLALTDALLDHLIEKGLMFVFVDMINLNFSNTHVQKLCLHGIVRIISGLEDNIVGELQRLAKYNIIALLSGSIRSSETELASWSIFLLHEFVVNRVEIDSIIRIKGLAKAIVPFIRPDDSIIPRIILKMLKLLCEENSN